MKTYSSLPGKEEIRHIGCNLCGSEFYKTFLHCGAFYFVKCKSCGLVYQREQPVFEDLKERYKDNYFEYEINNEKNFFGLMKLGLKDIDFESLTSNWTSHRFMDIGCATGMLLAHMREKGWEVQGVDICRESAEYGIKERKLDIHIGPLEQGGFKSDSFDIIHFSHLIEHVVDPVGFITEVKRILKPEGRIIVTTPNVDGLQAKLFKQKWRSAIADHMFLFTKKTLRLLLEKVGFKIYDVVTWGGLAVGTAPDFIKRPIDILAKKWGFGDVVLNLAGK